MVDKASEQKRLKDRVALPLLITAHTHSQDSE
jgi:hypothetical protein